MSGCGKWCATNENATLAAGLDRARMVGYGDNRLTVRAIKAYMDGALGSRGAWLLEPYSDQPDSTGLPGSIEALKAMAQLALDHGYQLCTHAIGDRANREVFNIYEEAFTRSGRNGADCDGGSSTPSICRRPTSRDSVGLASSPRCSRCMPRRTPSSCQRASATGAPPRAPMPGRPF